MEINKLPLVKSGLSVTELGTELIVFDSSTSNAHCLDKVGGLVFLACKNGEGLDHLQKNLGADIPKEAVQAALHQLEELGLIEKQVGVDRRGFLSAVGVGVAGIVVASVAAPSPAAAQSCVRCRLDTATGIPCDCSTCGQPCSSALPANRSCTSPLTGPCGGATSRCCFEYVVIGGETNCNIEGAGDYRCRSNLPFNFDCDTARVGLPADQSYYCCNCAGAPTGTDTNCP